MKQPRSWSIHVHSPMSAEMLQELEKPALLESECDINVNQACHSTACTRQDLLLGSSAESIATKERTSLIDVHGQIKMCSTNFNQECLFFSLGSINVSDPGGTTTKHRRTTCMLPKSNCCTWENLFAPVQLPSHSSDKAISTKGIKSA